MAYWALNKGLTNPIRAMAISGRFLWNDQGETPNTMLCIAEYPNGQYVFFNVRNVNYDGYQRQVENQYYFEDGGKLHEVMSKGVGVPEDANQYIVGLWLIFDPQTERHTGEFAAEANALMKDANRPGFQAPDVKDV